MKNGSQNAGLFGGRKINFGYTLAVPLRYCTTFKVRKFITYLFNFGRGYCGSFSMFFPKAPASCCKKILR